MHYCLDRGFRSKKLCFNNSKRCIDIDLNLNNINLCRDILYKFKIERKGLYALNNFGDKDKKASSIPIVANRIWLGNNPLQVLMEMQKAEEQRGWGEMARDMQTLQKEMQCVGEQQGIGEMTRGMPMFQIAGDMQGIGEMTSGMQMLQKSGTNNPRLKQISL